MHNCDNQLSMGYRWVIDSRGRETESFVAKCKVLSLLWSSDDRRDANVVDRRRTVRHENLRIKYLLFRGATHIYVDDYFSRPARFLVSNKNYERRKDNRAHTYARQPRPGIHTSKIRVTTRAKEKRGRGKPERLRSSITRARIARSIIHSINFSDAVIKRIRNYFANVTNSYYCDIVNINNYLSNKTVPSTARSNSTSVVSLSIINFYRNY